MVQHEFDREKHVYANEAFSELVKDALRFFSWDSCPYDATTYKI